MLYTNHIFVKNNWHFWSGCFCTPDTIILVIYVEMLAGKMFYCKFVFKFRRTGHKFINERLSWTGSLADGHLYQRNIQDVTLFFLLNSRRWDTSAHKVFWHFNRQFYFSIFIPTRLCFWLIISLHNLHINFSDTKSKNSVTFACILHNLYAYFLFG